MDCATQTISAEAARKLLRYREQLRRAADLRRFLDTDPKGVNEKQALVFPERGRLL